MKQNEVIVAEMQAIKKEKSIRVVNDCKMRNKMEWEQWQKARIKEVAGGPGVGGVKER